jgi:outer membrane receptor protein involved in Fe transport
MRSSGRNAAVQAAFVAAVLLAAPPILAQGITGAALKGTVKLESGAPLQGVAVKLTNSATGESFTATSGAGGAYFIDNVPSADTYTLSASAPDYASKEQPGIALSLGQRLSIDIVMRGSASEEVIVVAHADANADKSRTGGASTVKQNVINEIPLQGRNFTDLIKTDPRVSDGAGGGIVFAGQNGRYNNIQIDGGANNDLFGLSSGNGTPGGTSNAKPLSLEAVKEFQIQIAPFDVRLGDFAGGLVNAITKSGTNEFHGSLFTYFQNKALTRDYGAPIDTANTYGDYHSLQYGASFSGPIIEDKLHFFIVTDLQSKTAAFASSVNLTGDNTYDLGHAGFTQATATQFQNDLAKIYGITKTGDSSAPGLGNPDHNLFVKLSSSFIPDSHLEVSYNYVNANQDVLIRSPTSTAIPATLRDGYELSNSGYSLANNTSTARLKLTTNLGGGRFSNELLGSFSTIDDVRSLQNPNVPLILVDVGSVGSAQSWIAAGSERFSQANDLKQQVWQFQDNFTWAADSQHRITFGTSDEFFHFDDLFLQAATGTWGFNSLADFEAGKASFYQKRFGVTSSQQAGDAAFNVQQLGFYVQDEWSPYENLSITPGIRVDIPFMSSAVTNTVVLNSPTLPINTGSSPSGNALWSPRIGFNWDVQGDSDSIVRGGAGVFTGRPPYVFVGNLYSGNGLSQIQLSCAAPGQVPAFTPDGSAQPTSCAGGTGAPVPPANQGEIDYLAPNTKFPQNFRFALGGDQRLPYGLVGSVDFLHTQDVSGWYTTDANLVNQGVDGDGRAIYGTFSPTTGAATPVRLDNTNLRQAVEVYNKNGGHTESITFQLSKTWMRRYSITAAYTYSRSYDLISLTSSQALSNFQFAPVDGSLDNRNARPSAFDRPHKIVLVGTAALPYGFGLGVYYTGLSGTPYTWSVSGDANGDGVSGNDLPFIPANASQITLKDPSQFAALQKFINSQSCLRDAQGSLLQRGACRNPWQDYLDARVSWTTPSVWKGVKAELQYDIFDVLNLINSSWGHVNSATGFETANGSFLRVSGYDAANKRPVYTFAAPPSIVSTSYGPTTSRWRMQFGGRVMF